MAGLGLRRPSPSMVVSLTALVVAMGGTSYAVVKPSPKSVGSKELKRNAVATKNIKSKAVTSAKVRDNSLTGNDINEATLAQVPLAARALTADVVARANVAGGLDRVIYKAAAAPPFPGPANDTLPSTTGIATAQCDVGQLVVGGGAKLEENMSIVDSFPATASAWTARANNEDPGVVHGFTVFAICIPATTPG